MRAAKGRLDADGASAAIDDVDRDSLHILPLAILPLETPSLKRARMIKNVRLDSVIELFQYKETGSGQLDIEDLAKEFAWSEGRGHPDLVILRKVGKLASFDVYSLRISLRELEIDVNDTDALKLSEAKNKELTSYMTEFTRPLIVAIYGGDEDLSIASFEDVIRLFRSPDVKKAREKLRKMAETLDIKPEAVPKFLEDYGDIFLSLSYYRQCLDSIAATIADFLDGLVELRRNFQYKADPNVQETLRLVESTMNELLAGTTGRFEAFDRASKNMWSEISAERFRKVERLIKGFHTTNGGILCGLSVKMDAWARMFPRRDAGGPMKRIEFILSEMKHGLDGLRRINRKAPKATAPA
jgi:hypothetical protein